MFLRNTVFENFFYLTVDINKKTGAKVLMSGDFEKRCGFCVVYPEVIEEDNMEVHFCRVIVTFVPEPIK